MAYIDETGMEWSSYSAYRAAVDGKKRAAEERQQTPQNTKPSFKAKLGDFVKKEWSGWRQREGERAEARHQGQLRAIKENAYLKTRERGYPTRAQRSYQRPPQRERFGAAPNFNNIFKNLDGYNQMIGAQPQQRRRKR